MGTMAAISVAGFWFSLQRISQHFALIALAVALLAPLGATGQEKAQRKVHVLEQRPFVQSLRVEVVPMFGYTVNEVMYEYLQAAGTLRFHIDEHWSIGATYGHYFASTTSTFDDVQSQFELFGEKKFIKFYAGGEVMYSPVYAKAILFGSWIVHWNAYLMAGGGVTQTGAGDFRPTGTVGAGLRVFLTEWLSLNIEIKDHIYKEKFNAGDELINNLVLHTGLGIWIPFGFDYVYPK